MLRERERERWNSQPHNEWMQQTGKKGVHEQTELGREGKLLGTMQAIKILLYKQMVITQTRNCATK